MKKRVTRRILAGFLAFLMLFSTVTWDELALASVAAETVEDTENGDISDGDKEPVQDVSGGGAKIKEAQPVKRMFPAGRIFPVGTNR